MKDHKWIIKVMKSSVFFMLLFHFSVALGQDDWGCKKPNKKALKSYEKAQKYGFKGREAYGLLIEATKIDENFAAAFSVLAYLNEKKAQTSPQIQNRVKDYYEKTHQACPQYRNYEAAYWLANKNYQEKDYEKTLVYLNDYISGVDQKKPNKYKEAKDLKDRIDQYYELFDHPVPFDPKVVAGASTSADEYLPMLSPDNQFLFFTRKVNEDSKSAVGEVNRELFIQSRKKYDGSYSEGIPMPPPFNKGSYQGGSTISVDNRLLFITIVNQEPTRDGRLFSNGDIYYSEFKQGRWTDLKSIGEHINGRLSWEGQPSISADNKTLYFASAREKDNYGGMDLYKSERQGDGSWGAPVNLGPTINTSGNEKSPFMHSDSYTLYFSSDGHPGVGGQDIFYTKVNEFGKFESPKNIGVPINTEDDEHGFMVSTDGRYGYFSSNVEEGMDIFYFELPEEARPEDVVFVKGSIDSKDPDAAKGMKIELKNMATNQVVEGVVNEENGDYVAVVSASEKEDVMMMAKKDGYAFTSQYINSKKEVVGKPMRAPDLTFNPIEVGESYPINDINFATDSYMLNNQVMNILNEFIAFLKENKSIQLAIYGHTDNVGEAEANLELSTKRAEAVKNYLILEGVDPSRLQSKGFGEAKPIADNNTEEGRAKNRRTEFVILSK